MAETYGIGDGTRTGRSNIKRILGLVAMLGLTATILIAALGPASAQNSAKLDDAALIRQCIELAKAAVAAGNQPFGALLVKDGRVIMRAQNTVFTSGNILHHGETNVIAAAYRKYGWEGLKGTTLYTSTEPCPMCCGAIYISGVSRVVYGLSSQRLAEISGFKGDMPARRIFSQGGRKVEVTGPMIEDEAAQVMIDYVNQVRRERALKKKNKGAD